MSIAPAVETVPVPRGAGGVRRLVHRPAGAVGIAVAAVLALLCALGPTLAPHAADAQDISHRLQGPSWSHLLGTDALGRDLLSRLMAGTRIELGVAVPAVLAALVIGGMLGVLAGYLRGWFDGAVLVVTDMLQAFPAVVLALMLLALLGPSQGNLIVVVAVSYAPGYVRVARALALSLRRSPYVEAERVLGAGAVRIVLVHVLPNLLPPLLLLVAINLPSAIAVEAGLSFLGLGVSPPTPSWGVILADGFQYVRDSPWAVISACLALMVTTLGLTLLGEQLRDVLDPRRSGMPGAPRR